MKPCLFYIFIYIPIAYWHMLLTVYDTGIEIPGVFFLTFVYCILQNHLLHISLDGEPLYDTCYMFDFVLIIPTYVFSSSEDDSYKYF